jgi:hypothetical protein
MHLFVVNVVMCAAAFAVDRFVPSAIRPAKFGLRQSVPDLPGYAIAYGSGRRRPVLCVWAGQAHAVGRPWERYGNERMVIIVLPGAPA